MKYIKIILFVLLVLLTYFFTFLIAVLIGQISILIINAVGIIDQLSDTYIDIKYPAQYQTKLPQHKIVKWSKKNNMAIPIFFYRDSHIIVGFKNNTDLIQMILVFGSE